MHPDASAKADLAARLVLRSATPMLMTTPEDDFLKYNSYISPVAGYHAAGSEVGFPEEDAKNPTPQHGPAAEVPGHSWCRYYIPYTHLKSCYAGPHVAPRRDGWLRPIDRRHTAR